jgi:hypothetical protein
MKYFETSAKENINVIDLVDYMTDSVYHSQIYNINESMRPNVSITAKQAECCQGKSNCQCWWNLNSILINVHIVNLLLLSNYNYYLKYV